jgi:hypothetical protein
MIATADDYAWFEEEDSELAQAYCLTLVQNLTPEEVIGRLNGSNVQQLTGLEQVHESAGEVTGAGFVAVTVVDGWALIVEPNGIQGSRPAVGVQLSRGTVLVSHYLSVNMDSDFLFMRDGEVVLHFEPAAPRDRAGSHPDALVDVMEQIGFGVSGDGEEHDSNAFPAAAFALAEHLTGIRITSEILDSSTYLCATVPER